MTPVDAILFLGCIHYVRQYSFKSKLEMQKLTSNLSAEKLFKDMKQLKLVSN